MPCEMIQTLCLTDRPVVIDTNILLDCFIFEDEGTLHLREWLLQARLQWIATQAMQQEFIRVLTYPTLKDWLAQKNRQQQMQIQALGDIFSRYAAIVPPAPETRFRCKDPDDQKFIDLALAHQSVLLSKDKAVLRLRSRLQKEGVIVSAQGSALLGRVNTP